MRQVIVMLNTCLLAACLAGGISGSAQAQSEYPEWIVDRYCKEFANKTACRESLKMSELFGQTRGTPSNMDADNDGEVDQWAKSSSPPQLARCIYRHPQRPDWNFDEECFFTKHTTMNAFGIIEWHRVGVKNGSGFVLESLPKPEGQIRYSANEHPARFRSVDGNDCYEVIATGELFCIVPAGEVALRLAGRVAEATVDARAAHTGQPENARDTYGWCLLKQSSGPGIVLVDHGRCRRTGGCSVGEVSGEASCEQFYVWKSDRTTRVNRVETMEFIDGKIVSRRHDGCISEDETLSTFCFSETAFDPETHPVIMQKPDKPTTRQGWCAWRYPGGKVEVEDCTLRRECPAGTGGCHFRFEWADGRVTTAYSAEDYTRMIDASGVEGHAYWTGVDPKCATSKKRKAEFCFSAESKAAVMP